MRIKIRGRVQQVVVRDAKSLIGRDGLAHYGHTVAVLVGLGVQFPEDDKRDGFVMAHLVEITPRFFLPTVIVFFDSRLDIRQCSVDQFKSLETKDPVDPLNDLPDAVAPVIFGGRRPDE